VVVVYNSLTDSTVQRFNHLTRRRRPPVARKLANAQIELRIECFVLTFNFTFTGKTMADVANKYAENVAGKFYVDDQCIDCDLCRETAPANFKRNDDGGHSYVYKQPETPEEEALCKEAMEGCPVEAIGDNGA
jgi:ferredoxin